MCSFGYFRVGCLAASHQACPVQNSVGSPLFICFFTPFSHHTKLIQAVPGGKGKAATNSPEFRIKFPLGTVPAIDDGRGVCLSESAAIFAFLADTHGYCM